MSKELKTDRDLDNNLRPLKVGDKASPIELAEDKVRVNEKTTFSKDLVIQGDLFIEGSTADIKMTDGIEIETTTVAGHVTVRANALSVNSALYSGDGDSTDNEATLALIPSSGIDAKILLYDGSTIRWSIGNDANDSNNLKIDAGDTTVGADTKLTLEQDGDLITVGDVFLGSAKKIYFGADTHIAEGASDRIDITAGDVILLRVTEDATTSALQSSRVVVHCPIRLQSIGGVADTPLTGYAHLYNNDDQLHWKDDAGDVTDLISGSILAYRMIGEDAGHTSYTLTTSFVTVDSDMTVRFEAPKSGTVEVEVQIKFDGAVNTTLNLGLSDNATYNSIGDSYEVGTGQCDETDQQLVTCKWVVSGLTYGTTYNYWLGAKKSGGLASTLLWGGTGAERYPDFIMKVTALPSALTDYVEYD